VRYVVSTRLLGSSPKKERSGVDKEKTGIVPELTTDVERKIYPPGTHQETSGRLIKEQAEARYVLLGLTLAKNGQDCPVRTKVGGQAFLKEIDTNRRLGRMHGL